MSGNDGRIKLRHGKILVVGGKIATHGDCCCVCEECKAATPGAIVTVNGVCPDPLNRCADAAGVYDWWRFRPDFPGIGCCLWYLSKGRGAFPYHSIIIEDCTAWHHEVELRVAFASGFSRIIFEDRPVEEIECVADELTGTFDLPGVDSSDGCLGCTATVTLI